MRRRNPLCDSSSFAPFLSSFLHQISQMLGAPLIPKDHAWLWNGALRQAGRRFPHLYVRPKGQWTGARVADLTPTMSQPGGPNARMCPPFTSSTAKCLAFTPHHFDASSWSFALRDLEPGSIVELRLLPSKLFLGFGFFEPFLHSRGIPQLPSHESDRLETRREKRGPDGDGAAPLSADVRGSVIPFYRFRTPDYAKLDVSLLSFYRAYDIPAIDETFWARRMDRARHFTVVDRSAAATNAYRFINGAWDGFPGVLVDVCASQADVSVIGSGAEQLIPVICRYMHHHLNVSNALLRRPIHGSGVSAGATGSAQGATANHRECAAFVLRQTQLDRDDVTCENGVRFRSPLKASFHDHVVVHGTFFDTRLRLWRAAVAQRARTRHVITLYGSCGVLAASCLQLGARAVMTVAPAGGAATVRETLEMSVSADVVPGTKGWRGMGDGAFDGVWVDGGHRAVLCPTVDSAEVTLDKGLGHPATEPWDRVDSLLIAVEPSLIESGLMTASDWGKLGGKLRPALRLLLRNDDPGVADAPRRSVLVAVSAVPGGVPVLEALLAFVAGLSDDRTTAVGNLERFSSPEDHQQRIPPLVGNIADVTPTPPPAAAAAQAGAMTTGDDDDSVARNLALLEAKDFWILDSRRKTAELGHDVSVVGALATVTIG